MSVGALMCKTCFLEASNSNLVFMKLLSVKFADVGIGCTMFVSALRCFAVFEGANIVRKEFKTNIGLAL